MVEMQQVRWLFSFSRSCMDIGKTILGYNFFGSILMSIKNIVLKTISGLEKVTRAHRRRCISIKFAYCV